MGKFQRALDPIKPNNVNTVEGDIQWNQNGSKSVAVVRKNILDHFTDRPQIINGTCFKYAICL
jgi:hypothetical protein